MASKEKPVLFEEFSHDTQYKFQVTEENTGQYLLALYAYQAEYRNYFPVDDMSQTTQDKETAVKLGRALLALLE